jgi:GntR family transcriptional regulator, gluconate operon transcriptional repressor
MPGSRRLQALQPTPSLTDQATDLLRRRIVSGYLRHGDRLIESQIARELGISRGPVREALRVLQAEGLVRDNARRSASVVNLSIDDVREIYDLRAALETRAVRLLLAANADTDRVLKHIRSAAAALENACRDGDRTATARSDLAFHEAVCMGSGNSRLHAVFVSQSALLQPIVEAEERFYYESLDEIAKEHVALLRAIEQGEAEAAERAFDEHLRRASENMVSYLGHFNEKERQA